MKPATHLLRVLFEDQLTSVLLNIELAHLLKYHVLFRFLIIDLRQNAVLVLDRVVQFVEEEFLRDSQLLYLIVSRFEKLHVLDLLLFLQFHGLNLQVNFA